MLPSFLNFNGQILKSSLISKSQYLAISSEEYGREIMPLTDQNAVRGFALRTTKIFDCVYFFIIITSL